MKINVIRSISKIESMKYSVLGPFILARITRKQGQRASNCSIGHSSTTHGAGSDLEAKKGGGKVGREGGHDGA